MVQPVIQIQVSVSDREKMKAERKVDIDMLFVSGLVMVEGCQCSGVSSQQLRVHDHTGQEGERLPEGGLSQDGPESHPQCRQPCSAALETQC